MRCGQSRPARKATWWRLRQQHTRPKRQRRKPPSSTARRLTVLANFGCHTYCGSTLEVQVPSAARQVCCTASTTKTIGEDVLPHRTTNIVAKDDTGLSPWFSRAPFTVVLSRASFQYFVTSNSECRANARVTTHLGTQYSEYLGTRVIECIDIHTRVLEYRHPYCYQLDFMYVISLTILHQRNNFVLGVLEYTCTFAST